MTINDDVIEVHLIEFYMELYQRKTNNCIYILAVEHLCQMKVNIPPKNPVKDIQFKGIGKHATLNKHLSRNNSFINVHCC